MCNGMRKGQKLMLQALLWALAAGVVQPVMSNPKKEQSVKKTTEVKKTTRTAATKRLDTKKVATAASVVTMPLLGEKYARVVVKDRKLSGAVFYLAPGHGGPDPGAIGQYGVHKLAEDEYAYDVTIRLARVLVEHGATVYMTVQDKNDGIRDEKILKLDHDEVAYPNLAIPLNQTARLKQGTDAVNQLHKKHKNAYQRLLAIHVDSRSEREMIDVFFYHHQDSVAGKRLATTLQQRFGNCYRRCQPNRSYLGSVSERSSLYVVKNSHPPTVFIELGNIQNTKDQRRFLIADNRQALANWIYEGIQADYKRQ